MELSFEMIEDKIEFYEANDLATLQKKINEQIENNCALLLEVYNVSHQMCLDSDSKRIHYSAVVHFKLKKKSAR
ncbi:YrzA family protein [Ectobacillus sp. sgz5001026]|uniref:YrzA family protein n=1 Tax=Ectobacillus sp. sgz5001026 TaxID=3242473 RepID=UPI0036D38552